MKYQDEILGLIRNTLRDIINGDIPSYSFTDIRLNPGTKPENQRFIVTLEAKADGQVFILSAAEPSLKQVGDCLVSQYNNIPKSRIQYTL